MTDDERKLAQIKKHFELQHSLVGKDVEFVFEQLAASEAARKELQAEVLNKAHTIDSQARELRRQDHKITELEQDRQRLDTIRNLLPTFHLTHEGSIWLAWNDGLAISKVCNTLREALDDAAMQTEAKGEK